MQDTIIRCKYDNKKRALVFNTTDFGNVVLKSVVLPMSKDAASELVMEIVDEIRAVDANRIPYVLSDGTRGNIVITEGTQQKIGTFYKIDFNNLVGDGSTSTHDSISVNWGAGNRGIPEGLKYDCSFF